MPSCKTLRNLLLSRKFVRRYSKLSFTHRIFVSILGIFLLIATAYDYVSQIKGRNPKAITGKMCNVMHLLLEIFFSKHGIMLLNSDRLGENRDVF